MISFFLDRWNLVSLQETFPKPSLRLTSGSVTVRRGNLTLSCAAAAPYRDMTFVLNGGRYPRPTQDPPGTEAVFHFTDVKSGHEGRYHCLYYSKGANLITSDRSDTVEVTLQDSYPKPSVVLNPGSLVARGGNLTINCTSDFPNMRFFLYKGRDIYRHVDPPGSEALFVISGVRETDEGRYECRYLPRYGAAVWADHSEHFQIRVLGNPKPSISYEPVRSHEGDYKITCSASQDKTVKRMFLYKDGKQSPLTDRIPSPGSQSVTFPISGVNDRAGTEYRCSYQIQDSGEYVESPLSDPIQIGKVPKPSMPKPSIFYDTVHHVKGSYNINCSAPQDKTVKRFFLHTDGEQAALIDRIPLPGSQSVIFSISGVNAGDGTEYRCSYQIQDSGVSVESPLSDPIQIGKDLTQGSIVQIVLAGVVLLILTVIIAEHCYSSKRDGKRTRAKHYQND
ncbi:immunoglobulin superfamily member 1-like [Lissotriton helveticus]